MELFAWGANNYGQLANGQPCEQLERPFRLQTGFEPGTHLELGGGHTLMRVNGKLLAAGWNNKGRDAD